MSTAAASQRGPVASNDAASKPDDDLAGRGAVRGGGGDFFEEAMDGERQSVMQE
jgi:hypothetical protein